MANLTLIRKGLAARLSAVDGLRIQEEGLAQGAVRPEPGGAVAVIVPDPGTCIVRDTAGVGGYALSFVVKVLVSSALTVEGQRILDSFLDTGSARSVIAALEDESLTLGGGGEYASVVAVRAYGAVEYAGAPYFGVEIVVGVGAQ